MGKVLLKFQGRVVALGELESRNPDDVCLGVVLGPGRMKVAIISVFDEICPLPYPTQDTDKLQESIGSYVLWDTVETILVENGEPSRAETGGVGTAIVPYTGTSPDPDARSPRQQMPEFEVWKKKELLVSEGSHTVEQGRKSCADCKRQLPNFVFGQAQLCRWPINYLRVRENGRVLGDLYVRYAEADLIIYSSPKVSLTRKRVYNSTKRKLLSQEEKDVKAGEKRCQTKCADEDIRKSMVMDCCKDCCGTKWTVDDIKDVRKDIFGVSFDKKLDLLYQKINASCGRPDGMLLFTSGRFVCPRAFWQLHGISRSSFYNHRTSSNSGAKQGYHGNKGTTKPRDSTMESRIFLTVLLQELGEPMPHIVFDNSRRTGTDSVSYRLPACYDKKDILEELQIRMERAGQTPPSKAKFYEEWKSHFANYDFHKKSAFAVCTLYEKYKIWLTRERNDELRKQYEKERQEHLQLQMSGRTNYYTHNKTVNYVKALAGVGTPVPLKLAGILNRGDGPPVFAHVCIGGLWKQDPNFTVSSIAQYLRDCEDFNGDMRGDLDFRKEVDHPLLKAFMRQDIFEKTVLGPKHQTAAQFFNLDDEVANSHDRPFKKLPSTFYIQLDNSGKDNKNWAVMSFLSELVMRGVFKTVVMSFLIVGHTHEDVDAYFSKINMSLSHRQITSLPEILSMIYSAEERKALPRLITEVADYKLHAEPYRKTVEGISKPVAFKFYMENNMPMMKFQEKYGGPWCPPNGNTLWRRKDRKSKTDFSLLLPPNQEPLSAPMNRTYDKKEEVVSYLTAYIAHIGAIQSKTSTSNESYALDQAIIDYWKNIKSVFEGAAWETYEGRPLKHGFWPRTNHGTGYQRPGVGNEQDMQRLERDLLMREAEEELLKRNQLFVGHPSEKEREHFTPLLDIQIGVMLLIRLSDKFPVQNSIWVAKAMTCVIREVDSNRFNQLQVEWYRPKHRLSNASEEQRYALCMRSTQEWEKDPAPYEEDFTFVDASACIYCWTSRSKTDKLRLTAKGLEVANLMLQRVAEEEP
ncbi:hypothetical protein R1sor_025130 [Riccia sorocarpa]|uniref:DUF7869 domain-containing protein n=1 Tax=Riccia sorocarpa TaxID=122646 RepID=A0ABD3G7Q2_9MARC